MSRIRRSSLALPWLVATCLGVATASAHGPDDGQLRVQPLPAEGPRLDVCFVIDATGSMGDEIEQVKAHLRETARSITSGNPRPRVRFGIVVYRDRTDAEPLRVVPLTTNVDAIHAELAGLVADGGGDHPEDVDNGLVHAVHDMAWDPAAAHMMFVVGDAAPQDYGVDRTQLRRDMRAREIRVHTVQASGMDPHGASYFASLARETGGVAEVLTYRRDVVVDGRPRVLFERGGEAYVSRRPLSESERGLSFTALEARDLLVAAPPSVSAPAGRAVARGSSAAGAGSGAASPAAPSAAPADSDIGAIIAREARSEAARRGVAY